MLGNKTLVGSEFIGTILADQDPKLRGRYKVNIPNLMHRIDPTRGIWCVNHTHNWRITSSWVGDYGQYFPLQPGTKVVVKFFDEDPNSGYIDRIISDSIDGTNVMAQDCNDPIMHPKDRDEQYIIFKTPKKFNVLYINEDTTFEPNTICLVYNRDGQFRRRTVLRIDDTGIHTYTRDNMRTRIRKDDNKQVDGNQTENIKGYRTKHIVGDDDLYVYQTQRTTIDGHQKIRVKGDRTVVVGDVSNSLNNNLPTGNDDLYCNLNRREHIKGVKYVHVEKNSSQLITGETAEQYDGKRSTFVQNDWVLMVTGDYNFTTNGDRKLIIKKSNFTNASIDIHINAGANVNITSGAKTNIYATADASITTKANANINATADVNISSGTNTNISIGTNANIRAGANANISSAANTTIISGANANIFATSAVNLVAQSLNIGAASIGIVGALNIASGPGAQPCTINAPIANINAITSCSISSPAVSILGATCNITSSATCSISAPAVSILSASTSISGGIINLAGPPGPIAPSIPATVPAVVAPISTSPTAVPTAPLAIQAEKAISSLITHVLPLVPGVPGTYNVVNNITVAEAKTGTFVRGLEPGGTDDIETIILPGQTGDRERVVGKYPDEVTETYYVGPRQTLNKAVSYPASPDRED